MSYGDGPLPDLVQAFLRVQERKGAAGVPPANTGGGTELEDFRGVLAGTDLSLDDLDRVAGAVARDALVPMLRHGPVRAMAGVWTDGVLVGLALAELRAEQERKRTEAKE